MPVVINRLLCLDLPTAGLVIGYLGVFGGIWELIEILLSIVYFDDYYDEEYINEPSSGQFKSFVFAILFMMIVVCFVDLLSAVLLIQGTNKKSHRMLLPWLIIKGIALTIMIPVISLCALVGVYSILNGGGSKLLVNSILLMIVISLYSYLYLVVYSLYHYIRDEIQKPRQIDSEALYSDMNVQYTRNKI